MAEESVKASAPEQEELESEDLKEQPVETPVEPEEAQEPEASEEGQEEATEEQPSAEALEAEIAKLKQELQDTKDSLNRSRADFANYKRRTEEQNLSRVAYGKEQVISKLLPVLDNLDLALSHSDTTNMESYKQGVELVMNKLKEVLAEEGLEEIQSLGEAFNPEYHHGVNLEQNPEVADQEITNVFQKGYTLKGKVIRPSMVTVNQNS